MFYFWMLFRFMRLTSCPSLPLNTCSFFCSFFFCTSMDFPCSGSHACLLYTLFTSLFCFIVTSYPTASSRFLMMMMIAFIFLGRLVLLDYDAVHRKHCIRNWRFTESSLSPSNGLLFYDLRWWHMSIHTKFLRFKHRNPRQVVYLPWYVVHIFMKAGSL